MSEIEICDYYMECPQRKRNLLYNIVSGTCPERCKKENSHNCGWYKYKKRREKNANKQNKV